MAKKLILLVVFMFSMAYASVPLYNLFCKTTGYGGTTKKAITIPDHVSDRIINIRFDANVDKNLPWKFEPEVNEIQVKVGEQALAFYFAENNSDENVTGIAIYNVTPDKAGKYFSKVQCFCFDYQTLMPNQKVVMPVSFFIDPKIEEDRLLDDVKTITLSYTFFKNNIKS